MPHHRTTALYYKHCLTCLQMTDLQQMQISVPFLIYNTEVWLVEFSMSTYLQKTWTSFTNIQENVCTYVCACVCVCVCVCENVCVLSFVLTALFSFQMNLHKANIPRYVWNFGQH